MGAVRPRPDEQVVHVLRCPLCGEGMALVGSAVRCVRGHSFDVARQGYVNLLAGRSAPGTADSVEMVAAREEFLASATFGFVAEAVASAAVSAVEAVADGGVVVDVGAGTGWYLAAVLERLPRARGLALDVAKPALRRAARSHPRASAVAWDVWEPLPLRSGSAAVVLDVFAPRNGPEFRRVLRSDGVLVVVTPEPEHLAELVGPLGLVSVDARKDERTAASLGEGFVEVGRERLERRLELSHEHVTALAGMGPSARHSDATDMAARVAALPEPMPVTAAVSVATYRPA